MSTAIEKSIANHYVQAWQSEGRFRSKKINTLVIVHHDRELIAAVSAGLDVDASAVLSAPQSSWQFDQGDLIDAVDWALAQGSIERVIVAGHSSTANETANRQTDAAGESTVRSALLPRMIEGCQRTKLQNRLVEESLIAQIQQLSDRLAVAKCQEQSNLRLIGLLYRCETGTFSIYDGLKGTFEPLLDACG